MVTRPRVPLSRLVPLFALLTAGGCDPDKVTLDIRGTVTDRETSEPIDGASIALIWSPDLYEISGIATESGPDGAFRLWVYDLPCDSPSLSVGLEPWDFEERDVPCTAEPQQMDFQLTR